MSSKEPIEPMFQFALCMDFQFSENLHKGGHPIERILSRFVQPKLRIFDQRQAFIELKYNQIYGGKNSNRNFISQPLFKPSDWLLY